MRAFGELVAEKGHSGLTVQEIAERATINRATFYAHFRDHYELFDRFISEAFREELRRRLLASPGLDEENLKALILSVCEYLAGLNTACVVSWAIFGAGLQWNRDGAARSAEETADQVLPVIVRGLGDSVPLTLGVPLSAGPDSGSPQAS